MNEQLYSAKTELSKMQDELKYNDAIMRKVLEKEW